MQKLFSPTKSKIVIFIIIVAYVFYGTIYLTSFNTTRSHKPRVITTTESCLMILFLPSQILSAPGLIISSSVFTKTVTMREMLIESGAVGGLENVPNIDTEIKKPTTAGLISGIVFEIILLYFLSCLLVAGFQKFRNRNKLTS